MLDAVNCKRPTFPLDTAILRNILYKLTILSRRLAQSYNLSLYIVAAPLNALTSPNPYFQWSQQTDEAFQKLGQLLFIKDLFYLLYKYDPVCC